MSLKKAWMLTVGLLLVVGMVGCGDKPAPVVEPGPVVAPEPVAGPKPVVEGDAVAEPEPVAEPGQVAKPESVQEPEPVAQEPKQSPPGPEVGRDAAIAAIEKLGGHYACEGARPDGPIVRVEVDRNPFALTQVRDPRPEVTDALLVHLKGLTSLRELRLEYTQAKDAGLETLKGMTSLRNLHVEDTQVTDAGVNELEKALPDCRVLRD